MDRYFLKADWQDEETEVTKQAFLEAEKNAGFYSRTGEDTCATAGFSARGIRGIVKFNSLPSPPETINDKEQV